MTEDHVKRVWGRLLIEVDFGAHVVILRCNGRELDVTPTLHVASDLHDASRGLRRVQAIGDRDGIPPDAIHIRFLEDETLPDDVQVRKQSYFERWWQLLLDLIGAVNAHLPLKPRVRVLLRRDAARAGRGDVSAMIRSAALAAGAKSIELLEEGHSDFAARTG